MSDVTTSVNYGCYSGKTSPCTGMERTNDFSLDYYRNEISSIGLSRGLEVGKNS